MKHCSLITLFLVSKLLGSDPIYYGTWVIESHVPTGGISAITYEEADAYAGTPIIYNEKIAKFGNSECISPVYEEEVFADHEFYYHWRTGLKALGIEDDKAISVEITCASGSKNWWLGSIFVISPSKQMFIMIEGVWLKTKFLSEIRPIELN